MKLREIINLCERGFSVSVYDLTTQKIIGHFEDGVSTDFPKEMLDNQVFSLGRDPIDLKDLKVIIHNY